MPFLARHDGAVPFHMDLPVPRHKANPFPPQDRTPGEKPGKGGQGHGSTGAILGNGRARVARGRDGHNN